MKAIRMYGINDVRLEQLPVPQIAENEMLVRVRAASVCGTDVRMIRNGYNGIGEQSPRILGHELSGEIVKLGESVQGYTEGERVTVAPNMGCGVCRQCVSGRTHLCAEYRALGINTDGGFSEYVRIPAAAVAQGNVTRLPDSVSFEEAALNEPLSCAFNGMEQCNIRPGDSVLIIGAGPIGIMHAMLARLAGAGRVWVHDLSAERLACVKRIDEKLRTVCGDPKETVLSETGGEGADVVITACPSPAAQSLAVELCAIDGRVNFFGGIPASAEPVPINTNLVHYRQLTLTGTTRASLSQFRRTLSFLADGVLNVRPLISGIYPIEAFGEAIRRAGAADGLKNIIVPG